MLHNFDIAEKIDKLFNQSQNEIDYASESHKIPDLKFNMLQTAEMLKSIYDKTIEKEPITETQKKKITTLYNNLITNLDKIKNPHTLLVLKDSLELASQVINAMLGPDTVSRPELPSARADIPSALTTRDDILRDIDKMSTLLKNGIQIPESKVCCAQIGVLLEELLTEAKTTDDINSFENKFEQMKESTLTPFFKFYETSQLLQEKMQEVETPAPLTETLEEFDDDTTDELLDDFSNEIPDEEAEPVQDEIKNCISNGYENIAKSIDEIFTAGKKIDIETASSVKEAIDESQGDLIIELMRARPEKNSSLALLIKDITSKEMGLAMASIPEEKEKKTLSSTASALSLFEQNIKLHPAKALPVPKLPVSEPAAVIESKSQVVPTAVDKPTIVEEAPAVRMGRSRS